MDSKEEEIGTRRNGRDNYYVHLVNKICKLNYIFQVKGPTSLFCREWLNGRTSDRGARWFDTYLHRVVS